jgi:DNA invertase Pin-like site-specific DNA recombinase
VFTILSAVAENERDRIRERVRDAMRHRVIQRLYHGGNGLSDVMSLRANSYQIQASRAR